MTVRQVARSGRPRRHVCATRLVLALALLLAACTGTPEPEPSPTPTAEETTEPAPTGVQVAVVMPPPQDPAAAAFLDPEPELDDLAADRVGDVARIRTVVPDDPRFVVDVAALLADEGADLVCVLGSEGPRAALSLAERFPATRFCALGPPRDAQPANVDLFDVAHEELGHLLGVTVGAATTGGRIGLVLGDEGEDAARRRAGARAALAGAEVVVDATVQDGTEALQLIDTLEEAALDGAIVDVADPVVATAVAGTAPTWAGPRGVTIDASAGAALVRWSLRTDVIVGTAIDRLVGAGEATEGGRTLGAAQQVFSLTYAEDVSESVRAASEVAAVELGRGVRDPLEPPGR